MGEGIPQKVSFHLVRYAIGGGFWGFPMGILGILEIPINIFHFLSGKYYILGISSLQEITGWGLWGFVKSHSTLFGIFLLAYW